MKTLKTNNITLYRFLNSIKNCETVSASIAAIGSVSWKAHEIYEAIKKEVLRQEVALVSYNCEPSPPKFSSKTIDGASLPLGEGSLFYGTEIS